MCDVTFRRAFTTKEQLVCICNHHATRIVIYSLSVSILSHKRHDFQNKVTKHTMCVTRVRFLMVSSKF